MNESIACIICKNGKLLIARRNPGGDMGNRWEFPGGKVENGESKKISIEREMMEEFCVKAFAGEKITESAFVHKDKLCTLSAYHVELEHDGIEKPFVLSEHKEYKWVYPEEIKSMNFVDSDLKIYPDILKWLEYKK